MLLSTTVLHLKAAATKKFIEEQLPAPLDNLEKLLKENNGGDGFLVGSEVSLTMYIKCTVITYREVSC